MKFLKNLAIMLSLVMVLNTILPQAAVFAQEAASANQLAATEATANTESTKTMVTKEMPVPTVEAVKTVQVDLVINPVFGSLEVSGPNGQTGSGSYPLGSTLTIEVTPTAGFTVSSIQAILANGNIMQEVYNTSTANFVLTNDVTIMCDFNNVFCDIVLESSDVTEGTVSSSSESIPYGGVILLNAIPNYGYECTQYMFTYGPNDNDYTLHSYTGPWLYSTQATITATPNPGYAFSNWTYNNGTIVSTNATETVAVTGAQWYTANFVQVEAIVEVLETPAVGGRITGGGYYDFGTSVTITATPFKNYRFVQWINPQTQAVISKSSNYTFTASITTSGQYTAVFEAIPCPVTIKPITYGVALADIQVTPSPGTVNYMAGTVLSLSAASTDSGVTFSGWYVDGVLLTTANTYSYTVTDPVTITPLFNTDGCCVIVSGDSFSTMTPEIYMLPQGTDFSFTAPTYSTYDFANWTNSAGMVVSTNPDLEAVVKGASQSFVAHYTPKIFNISIATAGGGGIAEVSPCSLAYGENATVVATAVGESMFINWTDGDTGQIISTTPTYTFGPEKNTSLVAHFTPNTCSLDLTADPSDGGTVVGSADNLHYGQVINILATPNDGYVFNGWIDGFGNTVSTSAKDSVIITENMSLTASFSEIQYLISVNANPGEGGTVTGSGSFVNGTAITLNATPNPNYNFMRWTLGDSELAVSTNPQYNFTASEATQGNYTAIFELESYSVNISLLAQASVAGQVALTPESGLFSYGTVLPLNAVVSVPNPALHFLGWYENGEELSKDQNFDYTVTRATKLSAIFVTDYGVIISYGDPLGVQPTGVIIAPMNESKTISAATNLPYKFVNWTDSDGNTYTDSQLPVTVGPNWVKTYVAHYAPKSVDVFVAGQIPGGTASSSLVSLLYGEWLTVTAVPDLGYAFANWTDISTGIVFSTDPNWTFLPAADVNLQAHFYSKYLLPGSDS
ncbi:MAG: InlB B-repeat-containing protein [Acetobacterium sp.]